MELMSSTTSWPLFINSANISASFSSQFTLKRKPGKKKQGSVPLQYSFIYVFITHDKCLSDFSALLFFFCHFADQEASSFAYCQGVSYGCAVQLGSSKASNFLFKLIIHGHASCTKDPQHAFLLVGSITFNLSHGLWMLTYDTSSSWTTFILLFFSVGSSHHTIQRMFFSPYLV